jgi:hypothetical protein
MRGLVLILLLAAAPAEAAPTWASVNVAMGDLVVGVQNCGLLAGEISVGREVGPVQLRVDYDYLSLSQVGQDVPLEGVGHRLGGAVRWDWWRVTDDTLAMRFGFEAGAGQSLVRWTEGRGTLIRPDLTLGTSTSFAFTVGKGHRIGGDIGLRVLLTPTATPPVLPAQLALAPSSSRSPFDWGLLFTMGFSYAR